MNDSETWLETVLPYDLGDGNHRWSWLMETGTISAPRRNILWGHACRNGHYSTSWIDLASGLYHHLIREDPLELSPSVLCPAGCGDHGFIRGGKWVKA